MKYQSKLNAIFRKVFNDKTLKVTPETSSPDIHGWDSLSHINLIMAVEVAFKIRFSPRELAKMQNVGDLARAIDTKFPVKRHCKQ